jgi:hypothetical protein
MVMPKRPTESNADRPRRLTRWSAPHEHRPPAWGADACVFSQVTRRSASRGVRRRVRCEPRASRCGATAIQMAVWIRLTWSWITFHHPLDLQPALANAQPILVRGHGERRPSLTLV